MDTFVLVIYMFISTNSGMTSVVLPDKYKSYESCELAGREVMDRNISWNNKSGNKESNKVVFLCVRSGTVPNSENTNK